MQSAITDCRSAIVSVTLGLGPVREFEGAEVRRLVRTFLRTFVRTFAPSYGAPPNRQVLNNQDDEMYRPVRIRTVALSAAVVAACVAGGRAQSDGELVWASPMWITYQP